MSEGAESVELPNAETLVGPETRQGRNRLAGAIIFGHAVKHIFNSGMRSIIMPKIKVGLGLNRAQFGSLATAQSMSNGLSTLTAGFLGDRFSNRASQMLGLSLGLMGLSFLLAGYAPSYWTMFAVMFLVGVGPAIFHPPAISELSGRFPERRGFVVSLHGLGANVGEVLGPVTVAGVLTFMMWREVLRASFFPAILTAVLIWAMLRIPPPMSKQGVSSVREYVASVGVLLKKPGGDRPGLGNRAAGPGRERRGSVSSPVLDRRPGHRGVEGRPVSVRGANGRDRLAAATGVPVRQIRAEGRSGTGHRVTGIAVPGLERRRTRGTVGRHHRGKGRLYLFTAPHLHRGSARRRTGARPVYSRRADIRRGLFGGAFPPFVAGLISDRYGIHSAFIYGGVVLLLPTALLIAVRIPRPGTPIEAESSA